MKSEWWEFSSTFSQTSSQTWAILCPGKDERLFSVELEQHWAKRKTVNIPSNVLPRYLCDNEERNI